MLSAQQPALRSRFGSHQKFGEPVIPDAPGEWFSILDAARHLSVSERTVYRRADRGQLRRRTLPDGRVEVMVPLTPRPDVSDVPSDIDSQERAVTLVDRVSAAVSRQLESLTVELAASRERIEVLAWENGTLTERVAGLERELTDVRQMADSDRQRLTAERDAALAPEPPQEGPTGPGAVNMTSLSHDQRRSGGAGGRCWRLFCRGSCSRPWWRGCDDPSGNARG